MSSIFDENFPPPGIGALLRLAWLTFRKRLYERVQAAGFDDLQPAHISLFRYPTLAGRRPGQLAEESGLSKQAMNDLLRQLEAKGYLQVIPDPSDRRAKLITLTPKGVEADVATRSAAHEMTDEWARIVGPDQFRQLMQSLLEYVEAERRGNPHIEGDASPPV